MSEERYRVCKLVLLVVCMAAALFIAWHISRYHYSPVPVEGRPGRFDRFTGNIEVYLLERGWVDVRDANGRNK
jgi:hypothetical protein